MKNFNRFIHEKIINRFLDITIIVEVAIKDDPEPIAIKESLANSL